MNALAGKVALVTGGATLIDGTGLIIYFKIAQYFLGLN